MVIPPKKPLPKPPPLPGKEVKEIRIISGQAHNVITVDGKITKDLGPVHKSAYLSLRAEEYEKSKEKIQKREEKSGELQTVSADDVAGDNEYGTLPKEDVLKVDNVETQKSDQIDCPQCKSKNVELTLQLDNATRYKCKDCDETFVIDKIKEKVKMEKRKDKKEEKIFIPNYLNPKPPESSKVDTKIETKIETSKEDVQKDIKEDKIDGDSGKQLKPESPKVDLQKEDIQKDIKEDNTPEQSQSSKIDGDSGKQQKPESSKVELPKVELPKVETPKVELPKVETPKAELPKVLNSLRKELPKGGEKMPDKQKLKNGELKELPKVELPKVDLSSMLATKEVKYMADENAEKQIEEILKKREFQRNIEDAAKFALESKDRIENISKEIGDIEGQLGTVSKSVGELCNGVDCIKNDIKKSQDVSSILEKQINEKNANIENQINTKFEELTKRIQKLEQPTFVCDNCGEPAIRPLSSFCPNCGEPIHQWTDENGMPIKGWSPYWKRVSHISPSGEDVQQTRTLS